MRETVNDADERLLALREELPVLQRQAYLNTGTAGPLPRRVSDAITQELERQVREGRASANHYVDVYFPMRVELRAQFARLLGASADEIAITHHTTEGMNIAVWGLNWQPGDEIVTTSIEHEGALLPIYAATRRFGLVLKIVDVGSAEANIVAALASAMSRRTRLVVTSHVSYQTGTVLPVADMAVETHRIGAFFAVDGAQSAGVIPVNVHELGVDAYAVPGQKWLCGPEGVGALYVRRDRLSELSPTYVGHFATRDFDAIDLTGYYLPGSGATRYEGGTVYWPVLYGMRESLRWLDQDVGWEWIYTRTATMTRQCRELLSDIGGVRIKSPDHHLGLTAFTIDGCDAEETVAALFNRGVTIRSLHGNGYLRASTGFFNCADDLIRLREALVGIS